MIKYLKPQSSQRRHRDHRGLSDWILYLCGLCAFSAPSVVKHSVNTTTKKIFLIPSLLILISIFSVSCKEDNPAPTPDIMQLLSVKIGSKTLSFTGANNDIPVDQPVIISFDTGIDTSSAKENIKLRQDQSYVTSSCTFSSDRKKVTLTQAQPLDYETQYTLEISPDLKGMAGETFGGYETDFFTEEGKLLLTSIKINGINFSINQTPKDIDRESILIEAEFSHPLDPQDYQSYFTLSGQVPLEIALSADQKIVTVMNLENLDGYRRYYFSVSNSLTSAEGLAFAGFYNSFYTGVDSSPWHEALWISRL